MKPKMPAQPEPPKVVAIPDPDDPEVKNAAIISRLRDEKKRAGRQSTDLVGAYTRKSLG